MFGFVSWAETAEYGAKQKYILSQKIATVVIGTATIITEGSRMGRKCRKTTSPFFTSSTEGSIDGTEAKDLGHCLL